MRLFALRTTFHAGYRTKEFASILERTCFGKSNLFENVELGGASHRGPDQRKEDNYTLYCRHSGAVQRRRIHVMEVAKPRPMQ